MTGSKKKMTVGDDLDSVLPPGDGHGAAIGGELHVQDLWRIAETLTDDLADQAMLVALAVRAGLSANDLRRKANQRTIPNRPVRIRTMVRQHPRSHDGKARPRFIG